MSLDLALLAILLLFAFWGARSGALKQLLNFVAALLGWLAARTLGPPVAAGLSRKIPALVARPAASALLFFTAFILAGIVGRLLLRLGGRHGGPVRGPADRGLGALLGAAQAGVGLWVLLSAWAFFGGSIGPLHLRGSDLGALASEHNLLGSLDLPAVRALERLVHAARDPASLSALRGDPEARKLLDDPRLQPLLTAPADGAAAAEAQARVKRLLADPELSGRLERLLGRIPEMGN